MKGVPIDPEDLSTILSKLRTSEKSVDDRKVQEIRALEDAERRIKRARAEIVQFNTRIMKMTKRDIARLCVKFADERGNPLEQGILVERMVDEFKEKYLS